MYRDTSSVDCACKKHTAVRNFCVFNVLIDNAARNDKPSRAVDHTN